MAKDLQKLIREAFTIAYTQHKTTKLNESAASLANALTPEEKAHADSLLDILVNKKPGYESITWDPSGKNVGIGQYIPTKGAKKEIKQAEQNYIVESIFELYKSTREDKYRQALANFFTFTGTRKTVKNKITGADEVMTDESPLFKLAWQRYMGGKGKTDAEANNALERLEKKNPGALYNFIANSWQKMFTPEFFNSLVDSYVDKSGEISGANFGRYLTTRIITDLANQIRDTTGANTEFGHNLKSIDAPSNVTGKSTDLGDEDSGDIGSDEEDQNYGIGATDDDYNEDETNLYQKDRPEGEHERVADDEMEKSQKTAREMTEILIESIREAIHDFRGYGQKTPAQSEALDILEKILNTGETNALEAGKVNSALKKGKSGKLFINTVDRYLFENGFTNPEGKAMTFNDIGLVTLAKLVKLKNSGYKDTANLKEGVLWFIDELIMENFLQNNMGQIMENVYKKLSKLL